MSAPALAGPVAVARRARAATHVLPRRAREAICGVVIVAAAVVVIWSGLALVLAAAMGLEAAAGGLR